MQKPELYVAEAESQQKQSLKEKQVRFTVADLL
jgi:hypothetical protein